MRYCIKDFHKQGKLVSTSEKLKRLLRTPSSSGQEWKFHAFENAQVIINGKKAKIYHSTHSLGGSEQRTQNTASRWNPYSGRHLGLSAKNSFSIIKSFFNIIKPSPLNFVNFTLFKKIKQNI